MLPFLRVCSPLRAYHRQTDYSMAFKEQLSEASDSVELTEQVVLVRTRAQDLESIKKLNCWGSSIGDVKIVRRMPNLEVCSLSVNKLTTLRDFAHCFNLKELYVRTNNIQCLGDIHYLKNLPKLRSLWLSENPCANTDNYRMTVLKTLPQLQKLDNVVVTSEEMTRATEEGQDLPVPQDFSYSAVFVDNTEEASSRSSSESSEKWALPRRKRHQKKRDDLMKERMSYEEECLVSIDRKGNCDSLETTMGRRISQTDESCTDADDKDVGTEKNDDNSNESIIEFQTTPESLVGTDSPGRIKSEDTNFNCSNDTLTNGLFIVDNIEDESHESAINVNCSIEKLTESSNVDVIKTVNFEDILSLSSKAEKERELTNRNSNLVLSQSSETTSLTLSMPHKTETSTQLSTSFTCDDEPLISNVDPPNMFVTSNVNCTLHGMSELSAEVRNEDPITRQCSLLDRIKLDDSLNLSELSTKEINLENSLKQPETENSTDSFHLSKQWEGASIQSSMSSLHGASTLSSVTSSYFGKESKDPVNWEEYNRLRKEIGVKPIEPPLISSRLTNNDVIKTRNSNILQAVLSLVKELDKDSLHIVLHSVKGRLDGI
ncbi:uncharacterized protein LOC106051154 isoform X1 [Biomphalaria glabrata]|uniref:Uncharacterized protein LOC106051154 isoform X1 n=2 Tax=Biomphalaria glabrata TaxID=6526 RepID=A0A9W3BQA0_BIOGL|nr:uncharacterized protein LOC106051154 isoform X1 [Biomphalaria glabrata]